MLTPQDLKVTPERVAALTKSEQFYHFPNTTTIVCALTLKNGYTVVGESACVSELNFDAQMGIRIARQEARGKAAAAIAYGMRDMLANEAKDFEEVFKDAFPVQKKQAAEGVCAGKPAESFARTDFARWFADMTRGPK